MPRVSRKSLKSNYFHVITQGIEKSYIFEKQKSKEVYKKMLLINLENHNLRLLSYCIMSNHAHLLVYTKKIEELSKYMQCVNTAFAIYYNKSHKRVGYVFANRFKSEEIKQISHLHRTLVYIHLNPVSAGMCDVPEEYQYSSYNDFINRRGIATKENIDLLQIPRENFKSFFDFMHSIRVQSVKHKKDKSRKESEARIERYIKEHQIIDIIFQSEKVRKMINELEKEKISFSQIATFLCVTNKRLKEIISE